MNNHLPNKIKILFFIDNLRSGGKERRFTELLKSLSYREDISFEIVLMDKEIHYREILNLNINIHYLIRQTKKDLSIFKKFYKICNSYSPDIVHCWDGMTAIYAALTCKILRINLINGMVVDTPVVQNIFNKIWLRAKLTFPFSTLIIGNSEAGLKAYKAPLKKSVCIYNGANLKRFINLKNPTILRNQILGEENCNLFIIGMVASFGDRKDYNTLIEASKILIPKYPNIRFILVGDGPNLSPIKNSLSPHLLKKIFFLGKRSDVEDIVNTFDVGVLLTNSKVHGEGISNSILEYMALGKPVIATKGGGTSEIVINNKTGFLINYNNINQLVEKIDELIPRKDLLNSLGKNGKKLVHEKFDINVILKKYVETYKTVLLIK